MCKISATNWNGKAIRLSFRTSLTDMGKLCERAHTTIRRAGYTTYRLDALNDEPVPYPLQYA